jgi:hypothetical protein
MSADKVSIPSTPTTQPAPEAPTAVDAAVQVLAGGRAERVTVTPSDAPAGPRPGWLPEKFKSPEDMAKAYGELEQRMSRGATMAPQAPAPAPATPNAIRVPDAPSAPQAPAGAPAAADLVAKMTQEYAQTGAVTPETRQEFIQRTGLPDSYVDQQLAYMKGKEQAALQIAVNRLGGEGAVRELQDWATKRLSAEDRQAFNRAVYSDDPAMASLALDGLAAKFEMEVGRSPKIIAGRRPQEQFGGVVPYQSHAEWSVERKDPRYKTDPAWRAKVEDRFRAATELGIL